MNRRHVTQAGIVGLLLWFTPLLLESTIAIALTPAARAQNKKATPQYFALETVSSSVRPVAAALGDRVQRPGKERLVTLGSLNRKGAVSTLQIVREMPGFLRVDETGGRNKSLISDLTPLSGSSAVDDDDEDLAETLDNDTAETFLAKFAAGATVRRLGDRFKVKGESGFGAEVDIYEVVAPVAFKRDKTSVTKRYMFDSNSGLLRRVLYAAKQSGRMVVVQTVLSNYSVQGGYSLPGRIDRLIDGIASLSFTLANASVTGAVADNSFTSIGR